MRYPHYIFICRRRLPVWIVIGLVCVLCTIDLRRPHPSLLLLHRRRRWWWMTGRCIPRRGSG